MPLFLRKSAHSQEPESFIAPRVIALSRLPKSRVMPSPYVISLLPEASVGAPRQKSGFPRLGFPSGFFGRFRMRPRLSAAVVIALFIALNSAALLSAFEAHIINVTAEIEGCDEFKVRSKGYWKNHEEVWNPALLPQTVGGILVDDLFDGQDIFDANGTMADRLRAQLLALKFNIAQTPGVADALVPGENVRISELVAEADALLLQDPPASNAELEDMKDRVESVNTAHEVSTCPPPKDPCDRDGHDWDGGGHGWNVSVFGGGEDDDANGGDGGDGGDGGIIITGDACSRVEITNEVNTNVTEIDVCDGNCEENGAGGEAESEGGSGDTTIIIENNNDATVINEVNSEANTGGNTANGGNGGEGGDGGEGTGVGEQGAGDSELPPAPVSEPEEAPPTDGASTADDSGSPDIPPPPPAPEPPPPPPAETPPPPPPEAPSDSLPSE